MSKLQKLSVSLLVVLAMSFGGFIVAFAAPVDEYRPAVAAHRGASGYLPEHTFAAKAMAYALGVDYIEPDVVLTRDLIPIVRHDLNMEGTTNARQAFGISTGQILAANYTWAQIKQLLAIQPSTGRFPQAYNGLIGWRVHTLEEELLLLQGLNKSTGKDIGTYVETKGNAAYNIEPTIEVLKKLGYNHPDANVILQTFQFEHLVKARDEYGWVGPTCYLTAPSAAQLNTYGGWNGIARYADIWSPTLSALRAGTSLSNYTASANVIAARAAGIKIHCYTHNNTTTGGLTGFTQQEQLFDFLFKTVKVDGIFTDFADHVIDYLIKNGMREPRVQDTIAPYTGGGVPYRPAVAAHRGASGYLPEHTLESKAMAYGLGADFIEPDVLLTRDGVPIVLHDLTLQRTTDVAEKFPTRHRGANSAGVLQYYAIDFTWDEIKTLTVTESVNRQTGNQTYPGRFPAENGVGFRIHTLEEEILLVKGLNQSTDSQRSPLFLNKEVGIYPELKEPAFHINEGRPIEGPLLEVLIRHGYNQPNAKVILQSFDFESLKRARALGWVAPVAMLPATEYLLSKEGIAEIAEYAEIYAPTISSLLAASDFGWIPHDRVQWSRDEGMDIHTWTYRTDALGLQDRFEENELLDVLFKVIKVDGIFTDFTDVVCDYLYKNGMRGVGAKPSKDYYVISAGSVIGANGTVSMTLTPEGEGVKMSNAASGASGFTVIYEEDAELTLTLTAMPTAGHEFIGWFENDVLIPGAGATYTFNAAAKNQMLEARFTGDLDHVYADAFVVKDKNGSKNTLTIVVFEVYIDGSGYFETVAGEASYIIDNNVAGTYDVGDYKVYVKTTGRDKIEKCYVVK